MKARRGKKKLANKPLPPQKKVASQEIISLSPEDQLIFWKALQEVPRLSEAQRRLGKMMRGEL